MNKQNSKVKDTFQPNQNNDNEEMDIDNEFRRENGKIIW